MVWEPVRLDEDRESGILGGPSLPAKGVVRVRVLVVVVVVWGVGGSGRLIGFGGARVATTVL